MPRRFSKRFWVPLSFGVLLLAALAFHKPLLNGVARLYIVDEPVTKADAIVVLGGGANFRSFDAAKLYRDGVAPRILVMNSELTAIDRLGFTMPECELVRLILCTNGVPTNAITFLGEKLSSTYQEAVALRDWAGTNHAKLVLINTNPFHTRRVHWFFHKVLRRSQLEVRVRAIDRDSARGWWRDEGSLIDFQNELIKFAFYLVKY